MWGASLVVRGLKTPHAQCRGSGFEPWLGNFIPHAATKIKDPKCCNSDPPQPNKNLKKDVRYKHTPVHIYMCVYVWSLSHVQLFETPWTIAFQTPLSRGFSRQEYWSGLPFSPPGNLPNPGIKPMSPALAGGFFTTEPPGKPVSTYIHTDTMMEYCSIIKNENLLFATTWVGLEGIMLSVISQRKTNTLCVITYMWNLKN